MRLRRSLDGEKSSVDIDYYEYETKGVKEREKKAARGAKCKGGDSLRVKRKGHDATNFENERY